ncbi:MAG: phosphonate metabolism transcriptional regulator PhnF [Pelagimonas sp.]|uniref:phosphonate metabolism transcriptional regulator PhnF n=1 Tax=Pelagimonas sp. TaxID=2073170 RepID=UPI003D6A6170
MTRTPIWKSITTQLEADMSAGHYGTGDKLPTEAELSSRFGVNRHTVRRALADMAERGIVRSRRGAGVFVEAPPTDYPIGRRVRFHQNIAATGRLPSRKTLRIENRGCDPVEAQALDIPVGDPVLIYEGLTLAGPAPIGLFISVYPLARLPKMAEALEQTTSVTEAFRLNGLQDYTRRDTRMSAELANPTQALHLRLREGDPVLKTVGINVDPNGHPLEFGTVWFAADRVTLTVAHD